MHIRRFDRGYARRQFLDQLGRGILATGVLMPLWRALATTGNAAAAYPHELRSIEEYTNGALSAGDQISSDNVDLVRELLDPIRYHQIKVLGRRMTVGPTTGDIMRLSPWEYVEATFRNKGQARFDKDGNVRTLDGRPWIGGHPFPDPKSPVEVFAGLTLSWGRHDASVYATREYDIDGDGRLAYEYEAGWVELAPVGRLVLEPKPYWPGHEEQLRYQSVFFTGPSDVRGTSFLNIWPYDQREFPELYGYLPAFKRVRRFPTNQRFEPLVPGSTIYLSDAWAAGDPYLTWGNYRIAHRGPALAALSGNWNADHDNWEQASHGGARGRGFFNEVVELVPEAIVIDAEPVMYPRAPVGKKRVWFDARTLLPFAMVSFDRDGRIYRSFDGAFSIYESKGRTVMDGAHPYWSWTHIHAHNIQTGRSTRIEQVRKIGAGHVTQVNTPGLYERYLTQAALRRLGH
ncbi:MAG: DUF1329 domain-containing protein [Pseudomonadota bacterium]